MIISVGRLRGWPVTITEPSLLDAQVELRPVRVRDAKVWRDARVRNAAWLRPWEPTDPETPLYRSSVGPYVAMARTMRREARQGLALPWRSSTTAGSSASTTVGSILWGSARSGQVGYWVDEQAAGRGDPYRTGDGDRPLLLRGGAAPGRGQHSPGEPRQQARRGEAWLPSKKGCAAGICTSTGPGGTTSAMRSPSRTCTAAC